MRQSLVAVLAFVCFAVSSCSVIDPERAASAKLADLGGKLERDESRAGNPVVIIDVGSQQSRSRDNRRDVTDEDIEVLRYFPETEVLVLDNTAITNKGLVHLASLHNLKELCLSDTQISDDGFMHISWPSNIKTLELNGTRLTAKSLGIIANCLPQLEVLRVNNCALGNQGLLEIGKLENLRVLEIMSNGVSELHQLEKLSQLDVLLIEGNPLDDDAIACMSKLRNLTHVNMSYTKVGDMGMETLASLPHLEFLALAGTKVTNEGLRHLSRSRTLRSLEISDTEIDEHGIAHLSAMQSLQSINCQRTHVSTLDSNVIPKDFPAIIQNAGSERTRLEE